MENQAANSLTSPTGNMPAVSLRAQSNEALTQAIRSPGDEGWVIDRARICLKLFYDPDMSIDDRAEMMDKFGRALKDLPRWAVSKGFDQWEKTMQRRPSPGDIFILADRECNRIRDELADRSKMAQPTTPPPQPRDPATAEMAERMMQAAGFTPRRMEAVQRRPMATSEAELYANARQDRELHWTEKLAPDHPEMVALRAARLKNPAMRAAMAKSEADK